jgi:hypothetical protein
MSENGADLIDEVNSSFSSGWNIGGEGMGGGKNHLFV